MTVPRFFSELGPEDPGIFVTQSVHKQQAGFSQTSQIHKKDSHIKGQDRYIPHKVLNNAFMMHASTSPFYPLFASLDVNAKMQEGEAGRRLWADCVKTVVDARKLLLETCHYIKPFIPSKVRGSDWKSYPTDLIAQDLEFFKFVPGQKWHSFEGYGENQYFVDPCKFMLTTPGIDVETGEYENFGVPATILANYLRDNGIIPEKNDLNSILFLMTPAENKEKMDHLVSQIARFEKYLDDDAPLEEVLPNLYKAYDLATATIPSVSSAKKCMTSTRSGILKRFKRKCSVQNSCLRASLILKKPTLHSCAAKPSSSVWKMQKEGLLLKALCPTHRESCAASRVKFGADPCSSIS